MQEWNHVEVTHQSVTRLFILEEIAYWLPLLVEFRIVIEFLKHLQIFRIVLDITGKFVRIIIIFNIIVVCPLCIDEHA